MKRRVYSISEKTNSFVWLPMKCASNLLSWVLSYFEYSNIVVNTETNQIEFIKTNHTSHFGHGTIFPPNYEKLSFICAIRNPYNRALSLYQSQVKEPNVFDFEKFVIERIGNNSPMYDFTKLFEIKKPDYIIKTENLYGDLIKIPFINESDLYRSGILKSFCDKQINKSNTQLNPEEYLTPRIKEIIYNISSDHFDLFGYEK